MALSLGPFELVYLLHFLLGESIAAKIESVKGTLSRVHNLFFMQGFTIAAIKPAQGREPAWNQKRNEGNTFKTMVFMLDKVEVQRRRLACCGVLRRERAAARYFLPVLAARPGGWDECLARDSRCRRWG